MEERHWGSVAAMVPGRTNRQCRERRVTTLDPTNGTKKGKWTPEEDVKLTKAVEKHGKHWGSVAVMVPGERIDSVVNDGSTHLILLLGRT
jgi:hypothetical protein